MCVLQPAPPKHIFVRNGVAASASVASAGTGAGVRGSLCPTASRRSALLGHLAAGEGSGRRPYSFSFVLMATGIVESLRSVLAPSS